MGFPPPPLPKSKICQGILNGGLDSFTFALRVNSIAMDLGLGQLRTGSDCSKLTEKGTCEQPARVTPQCSKKCSSFKLLSTFPIKFFFSIY